MRDCFYDDPLVEAAQRFYQSTEWCEVKRFLPLPATCDGVPRVLDIGAGRGIASYALWKDGWSVTALEPDPSSVVGAGAILLLAGETGADINVVQEWGECIPFPDSHFDAVHARQVLHHARDLDRLCAEMARVLKPGAPFIATREHVISRREDLQTFLGNHPLHKLYGGENAFTQEEYLYALDRAGLEVRHVLKPMDSNINLFPMTTEGVRRNMCMRLGFPFPALVPMAIVRWLKARDNTPGRLYTFAGVRR